MAKSRARKLADIIVGAGVDINGNLTFDGGSTSEDLTFADGDKAKFGDASDLQVYHDGSNSLIVDSGTGGLYLRGSNFVSIQNAGSETMVYAANDGAVQLKYDNSTKLQTTASGIQVTGSLASDTAGFLPIIYGGSSHLQLKSNTAEMFAQFTNNGAAELYYDNSKKLETSSTGVTVPNISVDDDIGHSGDSDTYISFDNNSQIYYSGGTRSIDINPGSIVLNEGGGDQDFRVEGVSSTHLLFTDAANARVGIGTSSPGAPLHVAGNILSSGAVQVFPSAAGAASVQLQRQGITHSWTLAQGNTVTDMFEILRGTSSYFAVDSSGDVGIGTTSPARRLEVDFTNSTIGMRLTRGDNAGSSLIEFANTDGVKNIIGHDAGRSGFIIGPSATPSVTIKNSTGNVGIGTDAPAAILHVVGPAGRPTDLASVDTASTAQFQADASNAHSLYIAENASGALIQVNDGATNSTTAKPLALQPFGGDVGIGTGTTAPDEKFHVEAGNIKIEAGTVSTTRGLIIAHTGQTGNQTKLEQNAGGNPHAILHTTERALQIQAGSGGGTGTNETLSFWTNASRSMTIDTSQKVGIGLTSPLFKLHVDSSTTNTVAYFKSSNNKAVILVSDDDTNTYVSAESSTSSIGVNPGRHADNLNITSTGNVGIGTADPRATFDVRGGHSSTVNEAISFGRTDDDYRYNSIYSNNTSSTGSYLSFRIHDGSSASAQTETMVMGPGKVGIGLTSPGVPLEVVSNSSAQGIRVRGRSSDDIGQIDLANNSGTARSQLQWEDDFLNIKTLAAIPMIFYTNAAERMRINSDGDWMVGNTVANIASYYNNQAGCGWRETDHHFEIATTNNRSALELAKNNANDGELVTFRKQGNIVGRLGTFGTDLYIGQNNSGLRFEYAGLDAIVPFDADSVAINDNVVDLGHGQARFKNIHIAGGVAGRVFGRSPTATSLANINFWDATDSTYPGHVHIVSNSSGSDGTYDSGQVKFWNYNGSAFAQTMTIDKSGNVGIGTNAPTTHLSVTNSGFSNTSTTGIPAIRTEGNYGGAIGLLDTKEAGWYAQDNGDTLYQYVGRASGTAPNASIVMTYKSSGNIGIGTTNPTGAKLHVAGGIKGTDLIAHDSTGINLQTDEGTKRLVVTDTGNVLMGTTNTTWQSQAGLRYFAGNSLIVSRASNEVMSLNRLSDNGDVLLLRKDGGTAGKLGVATGPVAYMVFNDTTSNNVAALKGTSAAILPSTNLGADKDGTMSLGSSSVRFSNLFLSGKAQADTYQFIQNSAASGATEAVYRPTTGQMAFKTNSAEKVRIDSSGTATIRMGGSTTNGTALISSCTSTSTSGGSGTGNTLQLEFMEPSYAAYGAKKLRLGVQGGGYVKMDFPGSAGLYAYSPYGATDLIHLGYGGVRLDMLYGGYGTTQHLQIRSKNNIRFSSGGSTPTATLSSQGNLTLVESTNDSVLAGYDPSHKEVAVTGTTTVTATSWSTAAGSNGGYDVSNDNDSDFYGYGTLQSAGLVNRHVIRLALVGNYTADTWYPIATWNQLWDWCAANPGNNPHDGFSMYFRIYTYDVSAGGAEYLSSRMTDKIWINAYGSNSNQRHHIAIGAASGHAPNAGESNDHDDYGNNPYQMCINHHYNNDSYYPGRQTLEFKFKTARTGLTEAHTAQTVYVYGYLG